MEHFLIENGTRLLIGLFTLAGFGGISIFLKKSWDQSKRLSNDDLVSCQNLRKGDAELIQQLRTHIAFQDERTAYREDRMQELLAELGLLRETQARLDSLTRETTKPPSP